MSRLQEPAVVDGGAETVRLVFAIPTGNMKKGDKLSMHVSGEHLRQASDVKHLDFFNPTSITTHVETTAGKLGITLHHTADQSVKLNTSTRVLYVNGHSGAAEAYHCIGTHSVIPEPHTLILTPEAHLDPVHHQVLMKAKMSPVWEGLGPENVAMGTYLSTLGDVTKVLVAPEDEKGNRNAVHVLLDNNKTNKKFLGGRYTLQNRTTTLVHNKTAIVMNKPDFDNIKDSLFGSLKEKSDWNAGLSATAHKLDKSVAPEDSVAYVHVTIKRLPILAKKVQNRGFWHVGAQISEIVQQLLTG